MTTSMSIRDLTRSSKNILDYDYIDIEDKKQNIYKGVFIPNRYANEVKKFLDETLKNQKKQEIETFKSFLDSFDGTTENKNFSELKAQNGQNRDNLS
jgi:hypothetical protein